MMILLVFIVVFLAVFTQSLTGFGLALVSMPLLTVALGIHTAAPLVAIIALVAEIVLLVYYRQALNLAIVWRLALAAIVGVPVGIFLLRAIDEQIVLSALGVVVIAYALYALLNLRLPAIQWTGWAYLMGFLGGVLGGAYNTSGPPVIIYGNCRQWPPDEFKSNLQGFFVLTSVAILVSHVLARNLTVDVWKYTLAAGPAMVAGVWFGVRLDNRINPATFRKIVLWALLFLGLSLLLG